MEFIKFRDMLVKNFNQITKDATHLFKVEVDKDELWNLYLDSFPEGTNQLYRKRRKHDCSCCRHFIKTIGNVVVINDGTIKTIWDFEIGDRTYQPVINALNIYIKSKAITNVYYHYEQLIGVAQNFEITEDSTKRWDHFFLDLPTKFVREKDSIPTILSDYKTTNNVFKRSLEEISEDSILTVLELINQGSLYRGNEWKMQLDALLEYNREYKAILDEEKNNWLWEKSIEAGVVVGKIKNHSIGTLLMDITNDVELDVAVRRYEAIIAPTNYKRSTPIYSVKMLKNAKKKLEELGYLDSLSRRFAVLSDISINDVLFANRDIKNKMAGSLDVFEEMAQSVGVDPKRFNKVEEINIEKFLKDVLPTAKTVEALIENRHSKNFVSLIAPVNKDAKNMMKWDNPYSWAYTGNIADSDISKNVEKAGGNINGALRCSIQWNDEYEWNQCDYDLHAIEPNGNEINFRTTTGYFSGSLDVDIQHPLRNAPAVENIVYTNLSIMKDGTYQFYVHNYASRSGDSGFRAEIEFNGTIYSFECNRKLRQDEKVQIAKVTLKDGVFTIKEDLTSTTSSKEIWNVKTHQFIDVQAICLSPNYWANNKIKTGNKHYMFLLKDCINPEETNSFYNEYLDSELTPHRKVLEALGQKLSVAKVEDQLSGVAFSGTQRNDLIVKVAGQTQRTLRIKF